MAGITELWVMNDAGMCIFNYTREKTVESDLLGSYFSAIDMITQTKKNQAIGKIVLGKHRIIFERPKAYPAMFIGRGSISDNERNLQQSLNDIIKMFLMLYTKDFLVKWNGRVSDFTPFQAKIAQYFQSQEERMKQLF